MKNRKGMRNLNIIVCWCQRIWGYWYRIVFRGTDMVPDVTIVESNLSELRPRSGVWHSMRTYPTSTYN